jgi:hypothetical protein
MRTGIERVGITKKYIYILKYFTYFYSVNTPHICGPRAIGIYKKKYWRKIIRVYEKRLPEWTDLVRKSTQIEGVDLT